MSASTSRRAALCGLAMLPAAPGCGVLAGAPSELAQACLWAVRHSAWIDETAPREGWNDERLNDELDGVEEVYRRAIREPSAGLADTQAKSRMLLNDYEGLVRAGHCNRDLILAVTILREILALGAVL